MDPSTPDTIEIRQYLALIRRWLWLIILGTVLAAVAAFAASGLTTPIYEASTTLLIREGQKAGGLDYNSILLSERLAKTYTQLLVDTPILEATAERLGLADSDALHNMASAEIVRDTQLISLKVRNADPELAATIANTIPQVFTEQNAETEAARFAGSMQSLDAEMRQLQGEVVATQRALEGERARPQPNAGELARLEALLAQYRASYASLLQSYEQMRLAQATSSNTIIVTRPARAPSEPVLPRTLTNTLLAAITGAMLTTGAAIVIEYIDDTIKRPQDVERAVKLPTLVTVGRFTGAQGSLVVVAEPKSAAAEAYRVLRTNLQFCTPGAHKGGVAFLVTSPQPQEGKSTTLANLGVSLAQIGKRVLLVDCDLRRPTLHKEFGLPNTTGFTSLFLMPEADPESVAQATGVAGLRIISAGPTPANPAEVLDFPQTGALLQRLRELADYVLLDSPPLLSAADAGILAPKVNGVLLVVETGRTRSDVLRDAVFSLEQVQARIIGVVLNKAVPGRGGYESRYGYHSGIEGVRYRPRRPQE